MSGRTGVRKDPSSLAMRALIINPGFGLWQPQGVQTAKRCGVPLRPHDKRIHAPSETSLVRTHISLGLSLSVLLDSARVKNLINSNFSATPHRSPHPQPLDAASPRRRRIAVRTRPLHSLDAEIRRDLKQGGVFVADRMLL